MTKKFKIKDLEDDPNLPVSKEDCNTRVSNKVSLDNLSDDIETPKESGPKKIKIEEIKLKDNPKNIAHRLVYFERNGVASYCAKGISVALILGCLELIAHFMKYLDGIDVLSRENYASLFFSGNTNLVICKIIALLVLTYFLSKKEEIIVNNKGIYCTNAEITDTLFFNSQSTFITWDQMVDVKLRRRLFEPYIFFYDEKENKIGHLEFSINDRSKFFSYVEQSAGKSHPLSKISEESSLF